MIQFFYVKIDKKKLRWIDILHFNNIKYMINNILEINLLQFFLCILKCEINERINNYNKNKNKKLIILIINFEIYNN